jgi:hypothetical protein
LGENDERDRPNAADSDRSSHAAQPYSARRAEFAAFLAAVKQKFGAAAMRRAANYWLEALDSKPEPAALSARDWRTITIAAASRLACESIL